MYLLNLFEQFELNDGQFLVRLRLCVKREKNTY